MEIEGMIIMDLGEESGISKANNPWRKHGWVLETTGQYPRKAKFDVFGDRCNTLTFEQGKSYVVMVDVESREFNGRWYTDLRAYSARPIEGGIASTGPNSFQNNLNPTNPTPGYTQPQAPVENSFNAAPDFSAGNDSEDLPF